MNQVFGTHIYFLPMVQITLISVKYRTYMSYLDTETIFLHFMLSKEVLPLCEVDIGNVQTEEIWERDITDNKEIW